MLIICWLERRDVYVQIRGSWGRMQPVALFHLITVVLLNKDSLATVISFFKEKNLNIKLDCFYFIYQANLPVEGPLFLWGSFDEMPPGPGWYYDPVVTNLQVVWQVSIIARTIPLPTLNQGLVAPCQKQNMCTRVTYESKWHRNATRKSSGRQKEAGW